MADLYFFTDTDSLNTQTEDYGPLLDGTNFPDKDLYRVTSKLTGTAGIKAYAMLKGKIIAQAVTTYVPPAVAPSSPTHINLILQPDEPLNINIGQIKYIIYKGVLKSSVIDMSDDTKIAPLGSNNLVDKIYKSQENLNKAEDTLLGLPSGTTNTPPTTESLGFHLNAVSGHSDTNEINDIFLTSNKLEIVNPGEFIGTFDHTGFGIEIVVDTLGYYPKLALARSNETLIKVPTLTGSVGDFALFEHWNKKEEIHSFLDPAALIGAHYREGVYYKTTNTNFKRENKTTLYDNVVSKFSTKNRIYLDIRNEINKSFNYLRHYDNPGVTDDNLYMEVGTSASFNLYDYYSNNWPIYFISNILPTGNTGKEIERLRIKLPIRENQSPVAFVKLGEVSENDNNLQVFKTNDRERFFNLSEDTVTGYSNEYIPISLPRVDPDLVMANYIRIGFYRKPTTLMPSGNLGLSMVHPFNTVIQPKHHIIPATFSNIVKLNLFTQDSYMNFDSTLGMQSVGVAGLGNDNFGNYTFIYTPKLKQDLSSPNIDILDEITSVDRNGFNYFIDYLDDKLTAVTKGVSELQIASGNVILAEWTGSLDQARGLFLLIIDETIYMEILSQLTANFPLAGDYPVFLGLTNPISLSDLSGTNYLEYDLVLTGIVNDGGVPKMQTVNIVDPGPTVNVKVYTK